MVPHSTYEEPSLGCTRMIPATVTRNREIRLEDDAQKFQIEDYHSPIQNMAVYRTVPYLQHYGGVRYGPCYATHYDRPDRLWPIRNTTRVVSNPLD